jgi:hypothetical protein
VALADDAEVELLGLKKNSLQGDSAIVDIMRHLGVESVFTDRGVLLTKIPAKASLGWDFTNCPDLAQTVAVICAIRKIRLSLTGVESLKIKETDRIFALQQELKKLGAELKEVEKDHLYEVTTLTEDPYRSGTVHSHLRRPPYGDGVRTGRNGKPDPDRRAGRGREILSRLLERPREGYHLGRNLEYSPFRNSLWKLSGRSWHRYLFGFTLFWPSPSLSPSGTFCSESIPFSITFHW